MYAIAEIAGVQVKLEPGKLIRVPKLELDIGNQLEVNHFLMTVTDNGETAIGTPSISGNALLTVIEHKRDDKVYILKKKRRKGYIKQATHRQQFTMVKVDQLSF